MEKTKEEIAKTYNLSVHEIDALMNIRNDPLTWRLLNGIANDEKERLTRCLVNNARDLREIGCYQGGILGVMYLLEQINTIVGRIDE